MQTKTIWLVWNPAMNECVGFDNREDAHWTATGKWPRGFSSKHFPIIGDVFRKGYTGGDQSVVLSVTEHQVEANFEAPAA